MCVWCRRDQCHSTRAVAFAALLQIVKETDHVVLVPDSKLLGDELRLHAMFQIVSGGGMVHLDGSRLLVQLLSEKKDTILTVQPPRADGTVVATMEDATKWSSNRAKSIDDT